MDAQIASDGPPLVLLACHGVYDRHTGRFLAEHPEDVAVYRRQLETAVSRARTPRSQSPLLVISGGATKRERRMSESRSYVDWAAAMGLRLPDRLLLEEHALTSVDNLLFGVCAYVNAENRLPSSLTVVSWGFKQGLFAEARAALRSWQPQLALPPLDYVAVGELADSTAVQREQRRLCRLLAQGLDAYYADAAVGRLIADRDVDDGRAAARQLFARYQLPF